jgi:hypothetical protein
MVLRLHFSLRHIALFIQKKKSTEIDDVSLEQILCTSKEVLFYIYCVPINFLIQHRSYNISFCNSY